MQFCTCMTTKIKVEVATIWTLPHYVKSHSPGVSIWEFNVFCHPACSLLSLFKQIRFPPLKRFEIPLIKKHLVSWFEGPMLKWVEELQQNKGCVLPPSCGIFVPKKWLEELHWDTCLGGVWRGGGHIVWHLCAKELQLDLHGDFFLGHSDRNHSDWRSLVNCLHLTWSIPIWCVHAPLR